MKSGVYSQFGHKVAPEPVLQQRAPASSFLAVDFQPSTSKDGKFLLAALMFHSKVQTCDQESVRTVLGRRLWSGSNLQLT